MDDEDSLSLSDELDFHIPHRFGELVPLHRDDECLLHRQLICWLNIQRFWYFVLATPQVADNVYDFIERYVKQLEEEATYLKNKYSPSGRIGSSRREDYPSYVQWLFRDVK